MKAILLSVQPFWLYLQWKGDKSAEIRKSAPKGIDTVYEYCTKKESDLKRIPAEHREMVRSWMGKVPFKFTLNKTSPIIINHAEVLSVSERAMQQACLEPWQFYEYLGESPDLYALHISGLTVFDKPMELGEFSNPCIQKHCYLRNEDGQMGKMCRMLNKDTILCENKLNRPPQSWQYVEVLK